MAAVDDRPYQLFTWDDSLRTIWIIATSLDEARALGNAELNPIEYALVATQPDAITLVKDHGATRKVWTWTKP